MEISTAQELVIPESLLGLEDVKILSSVLTDEGIIIIRVQSTKQEVCCRRCGKLCEPHGESARMKMRHLSILGHETYIEMRPPRGICKKCNDKTTTQTLSWHGHNSRYTKFYEKHMLLSMVNSTLADVSIREDISDTAIQNVIDRYIKSDVDWKKIKCIGLIGIDGISLKKGHQDYVTIISGKVGRHITILAVLKGKEKATIKAFFESIPKKKRKTIIGICCDMCDGYINAAKEVFDKSIPIIVDRFHVAKLYRKSLVKLRKQELARLRKALSEEEYKSLKSAISILVKKQELYAKGDREKLEPLFKHSPALKAAYKLACQLTSIYNSKHQKKTAIRKLDGWVEMVKEKEITCFDSFINTLRKYQDYITNYFIDRNTSGFVEGLNNKLKVIKRRCYGIINIKNFFQRIFLDLEGYQLFLKNQQVTASGIPSFKSLLRYLLRFCFHQLKGKRPLVISLAFLYTFSGVDQNRLFLD